jgi:hypothetical protein
VLWDENQLDPSGIAMPRANPKLSSNERTFLNRLDCLSQEEIKKVIDKVDDLPRAGGGSD